MKRILLNAVTALTLITAMHSAQASYIETTLSYLNGKTVAIGSLVAASSVGGYMLYRWWNNRQAQAEKLRLAHEEAIRLTNPDAIPNFRVLEKNVDIQIKKLEILDDLEQHYTWDLKQFAGHIVARSGLFEQYLQFLKEGIKSANEDLAAFKEVVNMKNKDDVYCKKANQLEQLKNRLQKYITYIENNAQFLCVKSNMKYNR